MFGSAILEWWRRAAPADFCMAEVRLTKGRLILPSLKYVFI